MVRPEVSFHTSGERLPREGSHIIVNQAYVQYVPPIQLGTSGASSQPNAAPILFVHGGALTGAEWESTPDRRPGWAILASRAPYHRPVYCIDEVDSGRSQRCPDDYRTAPVEYRNAADMWYAFRFGPRDGFDDIQGTQRAVPHDPDESQWKPYEDLQFPIEHINRLLGSQSARRRGSEQYKAETRGLRDAIAEIGECDVVAHSNGCAVAISALLDRFTNVNVRRFAMIEPAPPITQSLEHIESIKTLLVWGDYLAGHNLWEQIMAHYEKMKGDVTVYNLPNMGIKGTSHFPMHDRNSDEIGAMILDWLGSS